MKKEQDKWNKFFGSLTARFLDHTNLDESPARETIVDEFERALDWVKREAEQERLALVKEKIKYEIEDVQKKFQVLKLENRKLKETIEVLSNKRIVQNLVSALEDLKKGKYKII